MITTLYTPIVKQCPYRRETDHGALVVEIPGKAPELHKLGMQVEYLAANPISHEDFTAEVALLVPGAEVTSYWETGPWTVKVTDRAVLRQSDNPCSP